ncbi:unnamed protein product, partial [Allacma fusca]
VQSYQVCRNFPVLGAVDQNFHGTHLGLDPENFLVLADAAQNFLVLGDAAQNFQVLVDAAQNFLDLVDAVQN